MGFKLGSENREFKSSKDTPIFKKQLAKGILAEANMDGTMFVTPKLDLNSKQGKEVVAHEDEHVRQMSSGDASYTENSVRWKGKTYHRKDGKIKYNGVWSVEGSDAFPWEKEAAAAEK